MTTSSKRSALSGAGIVVLIIGLLAAIGLWYSAGQRESDAVRNLARAPGGCDTTLDFEAAGEFTIYVETMGRFDRAVAGDCVIEGPYEVLGDDLPDVSLSMTSPTGDEVALANASGITYSSDGFVGESVRTFTVETPGDHILRVETPGDPDIRLAVAVGRDPSDGVGLMQLGAVLVALAALMVGVGLIVLARRSSGAEPEAAEAPPWPVDPGAWPSTPPGMPTAPTPEGWQPAAGPPSHVQGAPPAAPSSPAPAGWSAPPTAPEAPPPVPGVDGPPLRGSAPSMGDPDGSSGDGERSPWAPPSSGSN